MSQGDKMTSLKIKDQYTCNVDEIIKIATSVECPTENARSLKQTIKDYELLVPVVGEFSAGKSSLLNSFIGRPLLSVSKNPETARATELRYSAEEYAEVVIAKDESFDCKRISFEDITKIEKDWRCIRLYLNSEMLKSIEPIVMVDMPGFDSPRDDHNKAIASYLNRGVHYIVLTDVLSGTVTASMKRQIQDIQNMGRTCSFFVSKANLRSEQVVKNVCQEIQDQVEDVLGESVEVKPLYRDAGAELKKLIDSIDPEQLFSKVFKDAILQIVDELNSTVATKIAALKRNREKNKSAIRDMQEALDKLQRKRDRMIADARNNHFEDDVDAITSAAGNAIHADLDRLIDMAMHGASGDVISQEMNAIVKSAVIPAINGVTKGITEKISSNFQMELRAYQNTFSLLDNPEFVAKLGVAASQLGDMAKVAFNNMANVAQKAASKAGLQTAYKTVVGVAAIATDIICPLAEIVVLLLPEIISAITSYISKRNQEQEQRENIRSQILNAIPRLKRELRSRLEPELQAQNEAAINAISEQFNERINSLVASIQKANEALENNADVIEKMQKLESAKVELDQIKNKI